MSRTYRRTNHTPDWVDNEIFGIPKWRYHSDKRNWHACLDSLKWETNYKRRQDERRQLTQIKKSVDLEDFDFVDYKKKYLGFIWNWD